MREIGVGMVGYSFMGRAHSNAYRQVSFFYPELPVKPVLKAICGRTKEAVDAAASDMGWEQAVYDFDELLERDDIGLIDINTPNNMHVPMAIKAAQAGKHVICEKPLGMTVAETEEALAAVREAGVVHMLCHNYRRAPAIWLAKEMIEAGMLGEIYHWRGHYLQDWLMDPTAPLFWRCQKEIAGSGALGDLMAHSADLALWLVGDIDSVCGSLNTFVKQRPTLTSTDGGLGGGAGTEMADVTVDDAATALVKFKCGAMGVFEVTRFAAGHKNYNFFEINGSRGSIRFNLERLNELEYFDAEDDGKTAGFKTILASDTIHPFQGLSDGGPRFWPAGHNIGYEHTFINTFADLFKGIAEGKSPNPNFEDGVKIQKVLAAVEKSSEQATWVTV
ncbi:MAG: Gfo/Idh/MocA family oxidoreductase [candidate division WS1 bacterium]|jgi:predicted dehydrogenase|nr:Gfo/Idh/MocA family oxidoreductase [candidate division WS1 bacterium]